MPFAIPRLAAFVPALLLFLPGPAQTPPIPVTVQPVLATETVAQDADDPALWVHPQNPSRSLILGTNKVAAPDGALVVFGMDGKIRQTIAGLSRPNNVDVAYGLRLRGERVDIAVVTEREARRLRVFRIPPDGGPLTDISAPDGTTVFAGETGEQGAPMGIALYKRPKDGTIFAIVSRKTGPANGYLWQYRLEEDGSGRVRVALVRKFGRFSGSKEIEAVAVDNPLGYVYYADEGDGIHKWHADPDHPDADKELAFFGQTGFRGDREGIAIYQRADGTGYLLCSDQLPGSSEYHIFRREGEPGNPNDHSRCLKIVSGGADETDGLEATSRPVGPHFPNGLVIAMNSKARNFLLFRWEDFATTGTPRLAVGPGKNPRR